ncbi:hypothetical protein A7X12_24835 [Sphingomonas sp. TDK1]|nr:hypothetical protein A7X12_24835 [Sphingomonas sp. TDK1]
MLMLIATSMPGAAATAQPPQHYPLDLAKPFGTRSHWTFTSTQAPDIRDPITDDDTVPGPLRLCLSRDQGKSCSPILGRALTVDLRPDLFSEPHYLEVVKIVFPSAGHPLLLLRLASLKSINGDQRTATIALAYDRTADDFVIAYEKRTNRNNNQEIRYVETGPLRGAILSAEPTQDAPFAFWVTVSRLDPANRYTQRLRYRSATRYGDGNMLAVLDSEMPTIQRKLGLWQSGAPLPPGPCPRPHLARGALWCR